MHLPREYVAHMTKELLKRLSSAKLIEYEQPEYVAEVMTEVMIDELTVEARLDEEVRKILEEHEAEMKEMGASYEEMFRKVKKQFVRERKVVL